MTDSAGSRYLAENEGLALRQYTHDDDHDMYRCWQDMDTQKGYNGIFDQTFEAFRGRLGLRERKTGGADSFEAALVY